MDDIYKIAQELAFEATQAMQPTLDKLKRYRDLLSGEESDALYDYFWENI